MAFIISVLLMALLGWGSANAFRSSSANRSVALPDAQRSNGAPAEPAPAPVLFTIADGDIDVRVHSLHPAASIGKTQAAPGQRFVILDVTLVNKDRSGIEFRPGEQLVLVHGGGDIRADAAATRELVHPLKENSVVPTRGRVRFEVAYQVPASVARFFLHYRGFNGEDMQPLDVR